MSMSFRRSRSILSLLPPFRQFPQPLRELPWGSLTVGSKAEVLPASASAWCPLQGFQSEAKAAFCLHKSGLFSFRRSVVSSAAAVCDVVHGGSWRGYRTSAGDAGGSASRSGGGGSRDASYARETPRALAEAGERKQVRPEGGERGRYSKDGSGDRVGDFAGGESGYQRERHPRKPEAWKDSFAQPAWEDPASGFGSGGGGSRDASYARQIPRASVEAGERKQVRPEAGERVRYSTDGSGDRVRDSAGGESGHQRERYPRKPEVWRDRFAQPAWEDPAGGRGVSQYIMVPGNKAAWQKKAEKRLNRHVSPTESYAPPISERDEWYERRVVSLAQECKRLKPAGLVLLLNQQRSWIEQKHITKIVYILVEDGDSRRALRALRWMLQRTEWYHADYKLYTVLMEGLLRDKKLNKALEVYEIAINHGMKPEESTYVSFLHKLTKEGEMNVAQALDMYKSMKHLAGHQPPLSVQRRLIKMLCLPEYGDKYGRQAAGILQDMLDAGADLDESDFADVATAMAAAADCLKLEELVANMNKHGLQPGQRVLSSQLHAYGKEGRVERAQEIHREMVSKEIEITAKNLEDMLLACQHAHDEKSALSIFKDLTTAGVKATPKAYSILIQTLASTKNLAKASELLPEMELKSAHHKDLLRDTYNAVMHGYASKGQVSKVEELFKKFEAARLKSNKETFGMRLKGLVRAGRLEEARAIYDRMWAPGAVRPGMDTFNLMIEAYGERDSKADIRTIWDHVQAQPGQLGLSPKAALYARAALSKHEVKEELAKRLKGKLSDEHKETLIGLLLGGASIVSPDKELTYEFIFTCDENDPQRTAVLHHTHRLMNAWCDKPPSVVPASSLGSLLGKHVSLGAAVNDEEEEGEEKEEDRHSHGSHEETVSEEGGESEGTVKPAGPASASEEASESGAEQGEGGEVGDEKKVLHLRTMSHGSFRFYAHQFHPEDRNVIPRLVHRWLAPRSLAFWYMYGGRRCPTTGGIILNANSYTTKEVTLVTNALKKRQMDAVRKLKKDGNIIRLDGKSATWFWRLVYPHILPQLHELLEPIEVPLDDTGVGFTFRDDPQRNPRKLKRMREELANQRLQQERERERSQRRDATW